MAAADGPLLDAGCGLYASMLVSDRGGISGLYMNALHRSGEIAAPRGAGELAAVARDLFGEAASVTRTGAMAWLRVTPQNGASQRAR